MNPQAQEINDIFIKQKQTALTLRSSTVKERQARLLKLKHIMTKYESEILQSANLDFGKPRIETLMTELLLVHHEIDFAISHLADWMQPTFVPSGILLFGSTCQIRYEPRGVVLIISPWNYPWQLALSPLVAALAAGNTAIIKPSELTPKSSTLLKKILTECFTENEVAVFLGDKTTSEVLLKKPFDHIFFTGSTAVGKVVMTAAAQHLTTVTLELGGKSPFIVDASADLSWAAERLVWAKWINAGQTCIAPDLVFVNKNVWPKFRSLLENHLTRLGASSLTQDYSKIISDGHHQRLSKMITEAQEKIKPAQTTQSTLPLQPGQLPIQFLEFESHELLSKCQIGQEEIFGPISPVILFEDISLVTQIINSREKPLALYLMTQDLAQEEFIAKNTSSGSLAVNDVLVHLANPHLPFGGVNHSGHGSYHGYFGFKALSHEKTHFKQGAPKWILRKFSPPYNEGQEKLLRLFQKLMSWFG